MKKLFLPLVMMITLVTTIFLPYQGYAKSELDKINEQLNQLKRNKIAAEKKVRDFNTAIKDVRIQKEEASQSIEKILDQIEETGKQLNKLEAQVNKVTENLVQAGQELENAQERVATRDQLLRSRLRLMYTNGFVSYMDVLLSSTSFSDFLDRYYALKSIVSQDKDILAANKKDRDLITEKKVQIEADLVNVKNVYAKMEEVKQFLLVKEEKKKVLIAGLSDKEKEYEHISEEQERLIIEFANESSKLLAKKRKIEIDYYKGGKLGYPLVTIYPRTSNFGQRVDPISGKRGAYHSGIDFGAPGGTSIVAAETGVVIVAGWWNGYGNTVIIDHGKGMWTLYGHIRSGGIKVSENDTVKRGQKIAEVGSTGRSTGNHLHFEVRINGKAVDPTSYLK